MGNAGPGMLAGLRVIEIADERAEYTGLLLAGLGAEVVKIEPPEGTTPGGGSGRSWRISLDLERSLFFCNYNRNKKSVMLDLREMPAREQRCLRLLEGADGAARRKLRCAERGVWGWSRGSAEHALPIAGDSAHAWPVRRRRMAGFEELGPDPPGAGRGSWKMNCGYDP